MAFPLKQIEHAVMLAETGNYGAASKRLHISQPALSRSIQALEQRVGAQLFDRTHAGVKTTAVGKLLVDRGRALLASASDLEREVGLMLGLGIGSLKIGVAPYPADISVERACGRLIARYPEIQLDVRVGNWRALTRQILDGRIDLAIADLSSARENDRLVTEPLPQHLANLVVRPGHPLAGVKRLSLDQVFQYPLVTSALPPRVAQLKPAIRVDTVPLMRAIIEASDAVGLAPAKDVAGGPGPDRFVRLDIDLPWLHGDYGFIRLRDRTPAPAEQALMELIREVEAEVVAAGT